MKKIILIIIFCSMIAFNVNAARPAPPTITILNEPSGGFQLGDTIKLMAISTEDVTEMQCWAFFENKLNTEYNGYADAYYAGNNQYRADFEFTVTEGFNSILTIQVCSYRGEAETGGEPSDWSNTALYIKAKITAPVDEPDESNIPPEETDTSTPGFQLIFMLSAIALVIFVWRKKCSV